MEIVTLTILGAGLPIVGADGLLPISDAREMDFKGRSIVISTVKTHISFYRRSDVRILHKNISSQMGNQVIAALGKLKTVAGVEPRLP
jgi:hypothetical protein